MSSEAMNLAQRTTHPTSISLEGPLLEAGKDRARERRQSFSAYVATLLEADLIRAGKLVPAVEEVAS